MRVLKICKPCLNKTFPLRKQLLLGFLSVAAASLLLALAVVMGTTAFIGDKAESEARASLEEQIKRHITDASAEAAATIGERFRKLQYGVLDVTAFALRDAIQEDFDLDGGGEGYPLTPAHADLRDIDITSDNLGKIDRHDSEVDLSRSVWYYSNSTSFTADVSEIGRTKIAQTARLDLLWPTMYNNSDDTKAILIGSSEMFRYFPGNELSAVDKSYFKCEFVEEDGSTSCYDPTARDWYIQAVDAPIDPDTGFGEAIITEPYIDAIGPDDDWLVTLARAVRSDADEVLGVVAVDVLLEEVQLYIEELSFLDNGYSVFATAGNGTVLASGIYDREGEKNTTTVCALGEGICSEGDGDGWEDLLSDTGDGGVKTFTSISGTVEGGEYILVAAPVNATFKSTYAGGAGNVTHFILSAVPRKEIFKPVSGMADLIQDSTTQILVTTAIVACCTLAAVAAAVYFLAGSITRPIVKMTSAARSIARDGANTDVFGSVSAAWGGGRESGSVTGGGSSSMDSRTAGRYSINRTRALDYLLCRGDDEISTLAREFSLMITGLGRRGSAAEARGLAEISIYPKNPFTTEYVRPPPTAPSAPTATATATATAAVPAATNH